MAGSKHGISFLLMFIAVSFFIAVTVLGHPHEEDVSHNVDHESHLSFHLMDHYVKDLRPAANDSDPVRVTLKLSLLNINGPMPWMNFVKLTFLLKMSWHDPRLKWNVTEYSGLRKITLSSDRIWQPQLSPLESEILNSGHGPDEVATVTDFGDVEVLHTEKAHLHCSAVDVDNFPSDGLVCRVTLLSTAYTSNGIKLILDTYQNIEDAFDVPTKSEETGWRLEREATQFQTLMMGARVSGSGHPGVRISLLFQRVSSFYWSIFVVPAVLLALLVPLAFLIPSGSNMKALFVVGIALGEIILLVGLDQIWPHVSKTPNTGLFCVSSTVLACLAAMLSVVLNSLLASGSRSKDVPQWLKSVCFGRCGIRRLVCLDDYSPVAVPGRMDGRHSRNGGTLIDSESLPASDQGARPVNDSVQPEVVKGLHSLITKLNADDARKRMTDDWQEVVRVLDRMFFVVFFIMFITTAFALLA